MPGASTYDETVAAVRLKILGADSASADIAKFSKAHVKNQGLISKALGKQGLVWKKLGALAKKAGYVEHQSIKDQIKQNKQYHQAISRIQTQLQDNINLIQDLAKAELDADKDQKKRFSAQRKIAESELTDLKERLKLTKELAAGGPQGAKALEASKQLKADAAKAKEEVYSKFLSYKAGEDIGAGFQEAIQGLGARDMKGMAGGLLKAMGSGFKGFGAATKRFEARKMADPNAGKMGKAIGSLAGTLGNVVGMFAKLGPILSMVGGAVAAIVKLFIDAEAAAKEFNKEVIATTSTTELLSAHGGNASAAYEDLAGTLKELRDTANDWQKNMEMGISKKTHQEFLSTLGAEGVSIRQIQKDAEAAKMSIGEFSTEMVHTAVAYSRTWGVSLSEITQLQGEMVAQMGMGLESIQQSFRMMNRAATDSGIAANKFFAIIRNFNADMSLFNLRMEEAVGTLKMLGKVMSPRNAEQFMQTLTQQYKGMGLKERMGSVLKAGGTDKVKGMMQEETDARITGMANDVAAKVGNAGAGEELKKAIKAGPKATSKFMEKYQTKLSGADRDAILSASRQNTKLQRGGLGDVASALKDAGPTTVMKMLDSTAQQFFKKPIEELSDVELVAFEQLANVNDEQIDQLIKARQSITQTKNDLAYKVEHAGEAGQELSQEQEALLAKLNVTGTREEKGAKIRAMKETDIWGTMSELQRKQAMGTDGVVDYAKEQVKAIDTVGDKLERILDALMNEIYNSLTGIWDTILSLPGMGSQRAIKKLQERTLAASDNMPKEMKDKFITALKEAANTTDDARRGEIIGKVGARLDIIEQQTKDQKSAETRGTAIQGTMRAGSATTKKLSMTNQMKVAKVQQDTMKAASQWMTPADLQKASAGVASGDPKVAEALGKIAPGAINAESVLAALKAGGMGDAEAKDARLKIFSDTLEQVPWIKDKVISDPLLAASAAETTTAVDDLHKTLTTPATAYFKMSPGGLTDFTGAMSKALGVGGGGGGTAVTAGATTPEEIARNALGVSEEQFEAMQGLQDETDTTNKLLKQRGIVLNQSFLDNKFGTVLHDNMLKALRTAIFEYWMYSELDKGEAAEWLQKGGMPGDFGKGVVEGASKPKGEIAIPGVTAPANAAGGVVSGISGGMAVVRRPAPGEGFASIGKGEGISPAGGGGGGVVRVKLELSQDLKRVIRAEAADTVYEGKRRERFTG